MTRRNQEMTVDLKTKALAAIEEAKQDLRRDKYLIAVAYIVTRSGVVDFNLSFEGREAKQSAYAELVRIAREKDAQAIITINDSRVTGPSGEIQECIYLAVSGPGLDHVWTVCCPYRRVGDDILFDQQVESENDTLNLLPNWP